MVLNQGPVVCGLADDTVQSVHACSEDVEFTKSFTYLDSVVHSNVSYQSFTLYFLSGPWCYELVQHKLSMCIQAGNDSIYMTFTVWL